MRVISGGRPEVQAAVWVSGAPVAKPIPIKIRRRSHRTCRAPASGTRSQTRSVGGAEQLSGKGRQHGRSPWIAAELTSAPTVSSIGKLHKADRPALVLRSDKTLYTCQFSFRRPSWARSQAKSRRSSFPAAPRLYATPPGVPSCARTALDRSSPGRRRAPSQILEPICLAVPARPWLVRRYGFRA